MQSQNSYTIQVRICTKGIASGHEYSAKQLGQAHILKPASQECYTYINHA